MNASDWLWVWVGAAAAFAVVEMVTPFMFFAISFAVGAVIAAIGSLVDIGIGAQMAMFAGGSAGALAMLVPIGRRITHAESDEAPEGASRWVGRVAVVLEEIPAAANDTGLVRLERAKWRAETADTAAIPVGTEVEVIGVRGTRLLVAPAHEPPRLESGA